MKHKRIRSLNWDEDEKKLYRLLFKEYAQIIQNKSLDTNTNNLKTKAWEEFHKKFNGLNKRHRQLSQLKIQWKTMKLHARKSSKMESNKTDGGARPASPLQTTSSDAEIEIIDFLNPAEVLRDHNIYDSDGIVPKRKIMPSIFPENGLKSRKDHADYVSSMIDHGKKLKDEEHKRHMEMAEDEHKIIMKIHHEKLKIQHEKLKCAILEREILELQKKRVEQNTQ